MGRGITRGTRNALSVLLVAAVLGACADDQPAVRHDEGPEPIDTSGIPQVLRSEDLQTLGFDTPTLSEINDELFPLNTALSVLVSLKRSYDASTDKEERGRLNVTAMPYHVTADRYQREILLTLQPPLDSIFDSYIEQRKRAVGLQDWHLDHRVNTSGREVPGLVQPPGRRH